MVSDTPIDPIKTNTWGTYAQTPKTIQSSLETLPPEKAAIESDGDLGQRTCPARTSASPNNAARKIKLECKHRNGESNLPSNNSVFPEPNLPHMRESSPCGKFNDKSTKTNLCLGVDAAEGAKLLAIRSCGHVKVQDWNAMVLDCWSRGGTGITSAPLRYFSIRRRETKL